MWRKRTSHRRIVVVRPKPAHPVSTLSISNSYQQRHSISCVPGRFAFIMSFTGPHFVEALNVLLSLSSVLTSDAVVHVFSKLTDSQTAQLTDIAHLKIQIHDLSIEGIDRVDVVEASWGTPDFSMIVRCKFEAILHVIDHEPAENDLVWLDTDLYFLKDPRPALLRHHASTPAPIHFQHSRANACTGFFFMPGGFRDRQFKLIKAAQTRLETHLRTDRASRTYKGDEACINQELLTGQHKYTYLSRVLFPNGEDFFTRHVSNKHTAIMVHNNFIKGLANKIQRFKDHGMWKLE